MIIKKSLKSLISLQKNHFNHILLTNKSVLKYSSMATATRMTNQQQSFFASHAQQEQQAEKGDNNPLETLKCVTQKRDLCDENGIRKKD